jgi:hypothetical protein
MSLGGESRRYGPEELRDGVNRGRKKAIALLEGEVHSLQESLDFSPTATRPREVTPAATIARSHEIFVVHGQDEAAKNAVARLIELAGLKPVILHEQPNEGRTIIEKFEKHGGSDADQWRHERPLRIGMCFTPAGVVRLRSSISSERLRIGGHLDGSDRTGLATGL